MKRFLPLLLLFPIGLLMPSCSSQVKAKQPVSYHFQSGKTALLQDGKAYAPRNAPEAVIRAVAAGNRLQNKPYKWGGGHACCDDWGYDCSGTVSYVLRSAGLMNGVNTSHDYFNYGEKGEGKWITIYTRNGHVFMTIAGLRLDTGGAGRGEGPRWRPQTRSAGGTVMRHPEGL